MAIKRFIFKYLEKYPDFKRITPHGFRHTHCSLLFEAGATIKKDSDMKTSKQPWTSTLMLLKKQRMKLPTSSLPTLVFEIWVPRWVTKQKNRPSEISESLLLSHFQTYFAIG